MPIARLITNLVWIPLMAGGVWGAHELGLGWGLSLLIGIPAGLAVTLLVAFVTSHFLGSDTN